MLLSMLHNKNGVFGVIFCLKILGFGKKKKKMLFVYRFEEMVICFVAYLDVNNMC